jgi:hypothetical protein
MGLGNGVERGCHPRQFVRVCGERTYGKGEFVSVAGKGVRSAEFCAREQKREVEGWRAVLDVRRFVVGRGCDFHGLGYHVSNSSSREMFTTRVFECARDDTLVGKLDRRWGGKELAVVANEARGSNAHEGDSKPAPLKDEGCGTRTRLWLACCLLGAG